jgi:hypothetical protein
MFYTPFAERLELMHQAFEFFIGKSPKLRGFELEWVSRWGFHVAHVFAKQFRRPAVSDLNSFPG